MNGHAGHTIDTGTLGLDSFDTGGLCPDGRGFLREKELIAKLRETLRGRMRESLFMNEARSAQDMEGAIGRCGGRGAAAPCPEYMPRINRIGSGNPGKPDRCLLAVS